MCGVFRDKARPSNKLDILYAAGSDNSLKFLADRVFESVVSLITCLRCGKWLFNGLTPGWYSLPLLLVFQQNSNNERGYYNCQ
jgi:hypothetical protein